MTAATTARTEISEVPVLIVGAGPAGLSAAVTLARHGIEFLLLERRAEASTLPRATAISTRSMELLRAWGLEEEVKDGGVEVEWLQWFCPTLAEADAGYSSPTGLPSRTQAAVVSPTAPECVPQDHLERLLIDHLRSQPAARLEFGSEAIAVESAEDGVRVTLRDRGGETRVVAAQYLVVADGAHSPVRQMLGIEASGPERLLDAVTTLFRAPLWELVGERRYGLYAITDSAAEGIFLPAGRGDRWLYATMQPPAGEAPRLAERHLTARIEAGAGAAALRPTIERIGRFSFAAKLAERFRAGNAFLLGDAAHRVTPRSGTGMNMALHDGFDLGWKLAWVLRGWSGAGLLDSYEEERRPLAEHNVRRSADPDGTARDPELELRADLGGRMRHVWTADATGSRRSTLDLLGPGLTMFVGPRASEPQPSAASGRAPVTVRRLEPMAAMSLGLATTGTLLVRPDGVPLRSAASAAYASSPDSRAAIAV